MNNEYTQTITIKDIYGSDYKVPFGYKAIAFRPPIKGELYLSLYQMVEVAAENEKITRLILEKVPTRLDIYPKGYKIPEGYREIDFRLPNKGEYYLWASPHNTSTVLKAYGEIGEYNTPRVIIEKVPQVKGKKWVVEVLENEARPLKPGEIGINDLDKLRLLSWSANIRFNTVEKYYPVKITEQ